MNNNMDKETKTAVRIPCNATVKNYTVATLQRLGLDAVPGKVYNKIISGEGVIPKSNVEANKLVGMLLKKIPFFLPPVPPTAAEIEKYKEFNEKWCAALKENQVQQFQPVYLRDEVDKVLERRNYHQRCKRIHLVWCLSLKGEASMTPEKIADAIIEYDGTDWDNVPPLKNDTAYFVRLSSNTDEEKQKFLDTVEFISALSSHSADPALVEKLQNDLDVLTEFEKWKDDLTTYKYADRYQELVDRLQTAPVTHKRKKSAKKKANSATKTTQECSSQMAVSAEACVETPAASSEQTMIQQQEPENTYNSSEGEVPEKVEHTDAYQASDGTTEAPMPDESTEPTPEEYNRLTVYEYLDDLSGDDQTAKDKIKSGSEYLDAFAKFPDFNEQFEDVKRSVANNRDVKFPASCAVGIIKKKVLDRQQVDS